jgi:hypothetical protein
LRPLVGMMRTIGLVTEDFRFFHTMVRELKERGEPFVALGIGDMIPDDVGAVLTTEAERARIDHPNIVTIDDPDTAIKMARSLLRGRRFGKITIGIDPGRSPGIAVIGDGRLIDTAHSLSPEEVSEVVSRMTRSLDFDQMVVRIGHGDRTNRNRVIQSIWPLADMVEIVDESRTTKHTDTPDIDAAIMIAFTSGEKVDHKLEVRPTPGEVRDIQRLSRIESGGRVTISTELASQVARGKISIGRAVESYRVKEGEKGQHS